MLTCAKTRRFSRREPVSRNAQRTSLKCRRRTSSTQCSETTLFPRTGTGLRARVSVNKSAGNDACSVAFSLTRDIRCYRRHYHPIPPHYLVDFLLYYIVVLIVLPAPLYTLYCTRCSEDLYSSYHLFMSHFSPLAWDSPLPPRSSRPLGSLIIYIWIFLFMY